MRALSQSRGLLTIITLAAALSLAACGGDPQEGAVQDARQGSEVAAFAIDISSFPADAGQGGAPATSQLQPSALETACQTPGEASGQLLIVDPEQMEHLYNFFIRVDEQVLTVQTDFKLMLDPGLYTFYLLIDICFNGVPYRYAAVSPVVIFETAENTIHLNLNPMLIPGVDDVRDLRSLSSLAINYPSEIKTFQAPRLGITVDGGAESILDVNKNSTVTRFILMLPWREAPYAITARFFDGSIVKDVGPDDEIVLPPPTETNVPVEVVVEDLILESTYSFTPGDGGSGTASFYVPIPPQVLGEVGGASTASDPLGNRLRVVFSLTGADYLLLERPLSLAPFDPAADPFVDGGAITLSNFTPGPVSWSLRLFDLRGPAPELFAYCATTVNLAGLDPSSDIYNPTTASYSFQCALTMVDRDYVANYPVATVQVTVSDGGPVPGALVTANGEPVGITDAANGALSLFLRDGGYTFQAVVPGRDTSAPYPVTLAGGDATVLVPLTISPLPDVTPPGPVSPVLVQEGDGFVKLSWTNPDDADFAGVTLFRGETNAAVDPTVDAPFQVLSGQPGASGEFTDAEVVNGTTYYYTFFARDSVPNYSAGVQVSGTPRAQQQGFEPIVLTASRYFKPRNYVDGKPNPPLADGERVTLVVPPPENVQVLPGQGNQDRYLLFLYLGHRVKCMYLGGRWDRHLGGKWVEVEEFFEKAFKSPVCNRDHLKAGSSLTTRGPIFSRVITGDPHEFVTTVQVTIPVLDRVIVPGDDDDDDD